MLEWTGERYLPYINPSICGAEIHYEHLHRYAFASQFVNGKKVLDLACGEGYGSFLLSKTARCVMGIDINPETIQHASNAYPKDNLEFKEGSILNVPISGSKIFDVIICFEVIEHITEHEILLSEISRLLKDEGLLIISTPNKKIYSDGPDYHNPFHEKELYFNEFRDLLKINFSRVYFFGQRTITGSNIFSISSKDIQTCTEFVIDNVDDKFSFKNADEKIPIYYVALASNVQLNDLLISKSFLIDASNTEIALLGNRIAQNNTTIQSLQQRVNDGDLQLQEISTYVTTLNQTIVSKDQQLTDVATYVTTLNQDIASKDQQLTDVATYVTTLNQDIASKDLELQKVATYVTTLNQAIASKDQQLTDVATYVTTLNQAIASKDQQLQDRDLQLQDKDLQLQEIATYVTNLNQTIASKDRDITVLTTQVQSLEQKISAIETSIVWQLTTKFHRKIIGRVLPQNTRRRNYYDLSLKGGRIFLKNGWTKFYSDFKIYRHTKKTNKKLLENNGDINLNIPNNNLDLSKIESEKILIAKLDCFLSNTTDHLIFPKYENPTVSIIILTFNKSSFTYQCLESILEYTDIPYEVIIVDNGSTDDTLELLKRVDNIVQIKNEKNLGFIRGCNEGAKNAKGNYFLFLNNDTVVTKQWLSHLVMTIETNPKCGAVGCKLVWPNGKLQEAGSIIWNDGSASGYGRGDDPFKPEYSYVREIDYCSGACLLVRADLFKKLDGFDERYIPAYYEDADLCLGLQNLGYTIVYQPAVTVYHHEFTSSSKEHAITYMVNNQSKFVEKWEVLLKNKETPSPENILKARDIRKKKKILVLDDRIPASNQGSGYPRANKLLTFLGELEDKVTFYPLENFTPWQPYTTEFQQLGVEVFYGENLNFSAFSQQRSGYYDIIIVSRPHNFEKNFEIIRSNFPNAYLIYDAEALFSMREILKAKTQGINHDDEQIKKLIRSEIELMKKADLIITVSENEKTIIQKNGGIDNIIIFGHPVQIHNKIAEFYPRQDILFVGSFLATNGPNDDAIIYFVKEIWPKVQKQLFCKLYIVGITPPDQIQKLASSSIIITGFVPNLEEYYNNCRVFVVPHRYAAGIPLKLVEAMSYGIPSVVSELIASQLNLEDGKEVFIAGDPDEFARKIILLYQNEEIWKKLQNASIQYISINCNPEEIKHTLEGVLNF